MKNIRNGQINDNLLQAVVSSNRCAQKTKNVFGEDAQYIIFMDFRH